MLIAGAANEGAAASVGQTYRGADIVGRLCAESRSFDRRLKTEYIVVLSRS